MQDLKNLPQSGMMLCFQRINGGSRSLSESGILASCSRSHWRWSPTLKLSMPFLGVLTASWWIGPHIGAFGGQIWQSVHLMLTVSHELKWDGHHLLGILVKNTEFECKTLISAMNKLLSTMLSQNKSAILSAHDFVEPRKNSECKVKTVSVK